MVVVTHLTWFARRKGPAVTDPSPDPELGDRAAVDDGPPATPRWVKVSAIVVVVLAVLVMVMLLLGHGPGRHSAFGPAGGPGSPGAVALSLPRSGDRG